MKIMTKKEIEISICLGVIGNSQELAKQIKKSTDPEALIWASIHKNTQVRMAAIKNPNIPAGALIAAAVFETSSVVRDALNEIVHLRKGEIDSALYLIKNYPQISLDIFKTECPR